jgi:hypothetical protein
MAINTKFFEIIKLLAPKSLAFSLFIQKKLTQFLEALTIIPDDFRSYLHQIWLDSFPSTTRELELWRNQFGIQYYPDDESQQRQMIATEWASKGGQGKDYLQSQLQSAGFEVQVHENNPAIDPDILLSSLFVMQCGGTNAYAGRSDAFAGKTGGDLIVNGPILTNVPLKIAIAGYINCCCGNNAAHCGYFEKIKTHDRVYEITNDQDYWPYFFFIGGDATRDPVTHEITEIANANVQANRKDEFKRLILKLKPAQSWVGLLISYV